MKFEKLPRTSKQVAYTAGGIRNAIFRYGPEYFRFRKFLRESEKWDKSKQKEWRKNELKNLLKGIKSECDFYKEEWGNEIDKALLKNDIAEILNELPILDKEVLKSKTKQFYDSSRLGILSRSTSGSTGSPLSVKFDWQSIQRRQAIQDDHIERCGISSKAKSIHLSGHLIVPSNKTVEKPWIYNPVERQLFLSTYHLDKQHVKQIVNKVKRFKPVLIDGYPSAVLQLLRICNESGINLNHLKLIITTAETLDDDTRSKIKKLSEVPVCDYYAASEGVPYIQQCRKGTYHVRWQSGIFQILDKSSIKSEGTGVAIATSFAQSKTPLIRYNTGDLLSGFTKKKNKCNCELSGATIDGVVGRVEDLVLTKDGRSIGMFTYRTLKHVSGLKEAQVIQKDYQRFRVNCVLKEGAEQNVIYKQIEDKFTRTLGTPVELNLNVYESIPRGANGKLRLVISELH